MNRFIKVILSIFSTYKNCRVCDKPIKKGGHCVSFVGSGFCKKHAVMLNNYCREEQP